MPKHTPSKIEVQAMAVYYNFNYYGNESEEFQRFLIGMFDMLKEEFPEGMAKLRRMVLKKDDVN